MNIQNIFSKTTDSCNFLAKLRRYHGERTG